MEKLTENLAKKKAIKMMDAPDLADVGVSEILNALGDPNRLKIVQMIEAAGGELMCGKFQEKIRISKPTLSHHFNILRNSGVIATRIEGNHKFNRVRRKELNRRFPGLLDSILKATRKKI